LAHVLIYHVTHGHIVTWKYLRDTKFVFAVIVVLLFFWEDKLKARSFVLWTSLLFSCVMIVLMSGERKAYIAFVACYILSRTRWSTLIAIGAAGVFAAGAYTAAAPQSYVAHQLESVFSQSNSSEISNRYIFSVSALADQSDLVRTFVTRTADALFKQHPILGLGSTGYLAWAQKTYGPIYISRGLSMNVHGERHRVPVEGGVVGIVIALTFLIVTAVHLTLYWRAKGGPQAPSQVRGPAYLYALMFFYIYSEALDTTMLILIVTVGFTAGSLQFAVNRGALRGGRSYFAALRSPRLIDGERGLQARPKTFALLRTSR
jgi:hypothetical protein